MFTIRSLKAFMLLAFCAGLALSLSFCNRDRATSSSIVDKNNYGSMEFGGIERTYGIHIPASYDGTKPYPLLFVFHGLGGDGKEMERRTKFNDVSDSKGFMVVYPDGYASSWSDGSGVAPAGRAGIDDVGFVSALIVNLAKELRIDLNRVYATGFSNGGLFAQRLACELPDKIAAVASVGGTMAQKLSPKCGPTRAVSVLHVHGTEDSIVPWEGGEVRGVGISGWRVLSVPAMVKKWVDINDCSTSTKKEYGQDNGKTVRAEFFGGCRNNTEVVLYM
ncbi:MAG: alpha/beta hydrolase family esterase, partial [Thermodesulfobacteriota bacterium]